MRPYTKNFKEEQKMFATDESILFENYDNLKNKIASKECLKLKKKN